MSRIALLSLALAVPGLALACPPAAPAAHAKTAASDPAECAKSAELVGSACSYTTGMMAQRVIAEGKPWSFSGTLARATADLESHVAAPFTVGPDRMHVVANEILESLTASNAQSGRVSLQGRTLEVDGIKYFVLTGFSSLSS